MEAKEILALDVGRQQTGLARASTVAKIAEPLTSVATTETIQTIQSFIADHKVEAIVVGLPRSLKGEDTPQTLWVRQWVDNIKRQINLPFYWQDEALTSQKAQSFKLKVKSSIDDHTLAAAIILQDFLDASEVDRILA